MHEGMQKIENSIDEEASGTSSCSSSIFQLQPQPFNKVKGYRPVSFSPVGRNNRPVVTKLSSTTTVN